MCHECGFLHSKDDSEIGHHIVPISLEQAKNHLNRARDILYDLNKEVNENANKQRS